MTMETLNIAISCSNNGRMRAHSGGHLVDLWWTAKWCQSMYDTSNMIERNSLGKKVAPGIPQGGSFLYHSQEVCVPERGPSPHQSWGRELMRNNKFHDLYLYLYLIDPVSLHLNFPPKHCKTCTLCIRIFVFFLFSVIDFLSLYPYY